MTVYLAVAQSTNSPDTPIRHFGGHLEGQRKVPLLRLTCLIDHQSFVHEFESGTVVLGRSRDCNIVFPTGKGVSGRHAQLHLDADVWTITDLNSRYGTQVNDKRITTHRLKNGDTIKVGQFFVHVDVVSTNEAASPKPDEVSILNSINLRDFVKTIESDDWFTDEDSFAPVPSQEKSLIRAFNLAGETLLAVQSLDEMLNSILDLLFSTFRCERGAMGILNTDTSQIEVKCTRSKYPDDAFQLSQTIVRETVDSNNCILIRDARKDRYSEAASLQQQQVRSAMCAPLYHDGTVSGLLYLDTREEGFCFEDNDLEILAAVALFTAVGLEQIQLRHRIEQEQRARERLSRYSSPAVVDRLLNLSGNLEPAPEERELSILFADLSGFTSMSESMSPTEVATFLNGVFERLTLAIFEQEGTVDKFIGDAIMAIFGAPIAQEDHALRAVRAAIRMQNELDQYNLEVFGSHKIRMRIGVNSGPAVAGEIGSSQRRDYTVIGDTVNVASRLESSVAQPDQVVIGKRTYEAVKGHVNCVALEPCAVKGKAEPIQPYLIMESTHASIKDS